YVGEGNAGEPGSRQDLRDGWRIGERERIRSPSSDGRWGLGPAEGLADNDFPLVALLGLPDHHHQPAARSQRAPDVGERGGGVAEEHRAESADGHVKVLLRETAELRVGDLEGDVAELLGPGELAGTLDRGRGDVDPERVTGPGGARRLAGGLPGPAADVEDVGAETDAAGPAQDLVMPPQFGVVAYGQRALSPMSITVRPGCAGRSMSASACPAWASRITRPTSRSGRSVRSATWDSIAG